jgi:3-oxoacyl-[acyl-carrier protein] reductase
MELGLRGKTVLITASSKGIGRATAEEFIREDAKVAICSRSEKNLLRTVNEIKNLYDVEPFWVVCDINKPEEIENTVKLVETELGNIDVLVNNCGGPVPGTFEDLDESNWDDAYTQVMLSSIRFVKLVLPAMKRKHWGRIVNITSISVKQPVENLILSNAFRSGLTAYAKTLSGEIGEYNITVNNVAPGYTLTGRLYELAVNKAKRIGESHEHVLAEMANEVPLKRLARPDEVASLIVYLASDKASFITGSTISVDGGVIKSTY